MANFYCCLKIEFREEEPLGEFREDEPEFSGGPRKSEKRSLKDNEIGETPRAANGANSVCCSIVSEWWSKTTLRDGENFMSVEFES